MKHKIVAFIPARGMSKSIPRKNLIELGGKPLIVWSIELAKAVSEFEDVVVSTDDAEIAEVARQAGAKVPFVRPSELATDTSTDLDVAQHFVQWMQDSELSDCTGIAHLRPTGPLRNVKTVKTAVSLFKDRYSQLDSLRSIERSSLSPFKMWFQSADGLLVPILEDADINEAHSAPRQLLRQAMWQNGYIDIIKPEIIRQGSICGERVLGFEIDEEFEDLDYFEDFEKLEKRLQMSTCTQIDKKKQFHSK